MEQYTIYCTPEQTLRAYKLGAPINKIGGFAKNYHYENVLDIDRELYVFPTAEQMCGWLFKKRGITMDIKNGLHDTTIYIYEFADNYICTVIDVMPEDTTLKAIDKALDYLESFNNKQK